MLLFSFFYFFTFLFFIIIIFFLRSYVPRLDSAIHMYSICMLPDMAASARVGNNSTTLAYKARGNAPPMKELHTHTPMQQPVRVQGCWNSEFILGQVRGTKVPYLIPLAQLCDYVSRIPLRGLDSFIEGECTWISAFCERNP